MTDNKPLNFFAFAHSLGYTKDHDIMNKDNERLYLPFMVNRNFSQHMDTILYANEMNQRPHLSKQMQFDYYFYSVRKRKRYGKWPKKVTEENLELVQGAYNCSMQKALDILRILSEPDIQKLKDFVYEGGNSKK